MSPISIQKLTAMLSEDHKQTKTKLPIDNNKLKWLLDTKREYMGTLINPMKTEEGDKWVKQNLDFILYSMKHTRKGKDNDTSYLFNTYSSHRKDGRRGYGRVTINKGKSALNLNKAVRGFLFEDYVSDVDFKNMHPQMMLQLAELFQEQKCAKLIKTYNENRENWFKEMITVNPKLNRQICKAIGYTFLYEGNIEYRFKEFELDIPKKGDPLWLCYATCHDACIEVKKLREKIKFHFSDTWKELPYAKDKSESRKDAGKFSSFIQHLEHYILLKFAKKCKGDGYDVCDLQHDGLFLSEQGYPAEPAQEWLDEVSSFIFDETGFKLELSCKPFDIPNVFREYNPVMNDENYVDKEKVKQAVPNTPQFDMNSIKQGYFPHFNQAEKDLLGRLIAEKYVIRVGESWFIINIETGKYTHKRPYSKDKYKDATGGTLLAGTEFCDEIKVYDKFVFTDPNNVKPTEWNTYFKSLKYDPEDCGALSVEELGKIQLVLDHFIEQFCRNDMDSFEFLMKILQDKFAKPFELPSKPVCLVLFGIEGAGKTMPIEKLFGNAFGYQFISPSASFETITNPSGFTDKIESKLAVIMNEIPSADYNHKKMYENFKAMVSDRFRNSRVMYQGAGDVKNTIFYVATTNNKNAFQLSQTDRRYFMLDVSSSKKGDDVYFERLAQTLDEHWKLIVKYILGYETKKHMKIPDNSIRKHCKDIGLSYVGQYLKWKFEEQNWEPNDKGIKISDYHTEYKIYMEDHHGRKPLIQAKLKGELEGLFYFKHERKVGDSLKLMYIEDLAEMKKAVGVDDE